MPDTDAHSLQTLAPLVDKICEIAREELPAPQTFEIRIWDNGGFDIYVYHEKGDREREQIVYESETSGLS